MQTTLMTIVTDGALVLIGNHTIIGVIIMVQNLIFL